VQRKALWHGTGYFALYINLGALFMRIYRYISHFTLFLISLSSALFASYLQKSDVPEVMGQLFTYHIDQKEMTPLIMKRSLKIYIQNFDTEYAYLSLDEAAPYVAPSEPSVASIIERYGNHDYTTFFEINRVLATAIQRARQWREQEKADELLMEAKLVEDLPLHHKEFAKSQGDVRARHHTFFVHLIAMNMKKLGEESYQGKEQKLIALSEKQLRLLEDSYLGVNEFGASLSEEEQVSLVLTRMLKAMANSLDAHTAFYSPDEALSMRTQLAKGMCGIGVVLQEGIDGIMIAELIKGGPAESCQELFVGDTIVKVDDLDVQQHSFPHILELMRGQEGTRLKLQVARQEQLYDIELTRMQITLGDKRVDVSSEPYGDGIIGKLTLHSFYEGADGITSESDIKEAVATLQKEGPLYGLVIDLRENSGGFLSQAVKVSGLFMKSGVVVISKYSGDNIKYYRSFNRNKFYKGPVVVLISRGSASAAEILAQTLQDYGVAIVVGDEQSYGKGTIQHQTITDERAKAFFKVTIGRYYTVSGRSTQIEGVKSDIVVPTKLNFEEMGEGFAEYPLAADRVPDAYNDNLNDVDPQVKKWFKHHYASGMQVKSEKWSESKGLLKANSERRLQENKNFQAFLQTVQEEEVAEYGQRDLQMAESVNILKDMIFLEHSDQ